ncbi:extracellular solute-binding protein [Micromonospora zhanjiangensis]
MVFHRRLSASLSRRAFLRGGLASAAVLSTGAGLAGCGTAAVPPKQAEAGCVSQDRSDLEPTLNFSNWIRYIDVDAKDPTKRPTLETFQEMTGIRVTYTEDINDNAEFFGKVRGELAACQSINRDIIVVTDWLAARLIRLGWVQRLDTAAMPNVQRFLLPSLRNRSFDGDNRLAIPWQSGLAGLAYNGHETKAVRTVDELLTRRDLKGRVTLLAEMRDTMGLIMQSNGHDPANFTDRHFDLALEKLQRAVRNGQIRRFTGNDYAPDLAKGDIAACFGWSGDVIQLAAEDPKIRFVTPESGMMIFSDDMLVPNRSTHRANAERLIDYYYDPATAARLAAAVNYICPVVGARDEMERIDPALARNPLIFPDDAMLLKSKLFMSLTEPQEKTYEEKFQRVTGG